MNVFTASGNVGRDCELRQTPNGKSIGSFSIAVKQGYGQHEKTSWLNCKIFGKQAEAISQYITKGSKVTVTGEFVEEKWQGNDGVEKSANVIIVRDIDLPPKQQGMPQSQPQRQQQPQAQPQHDESFDSDIPF